MIRIKPNYAPAPLPKIDWTGKDSAISPLSANFIPFAQSNRPDILVTNGTSEFECHKAILQMLSSTVADILDGDINAKTIPLEDISNNGLQWLSNFIYAIPSEKRTFDGVLKQLTRMPHQSLEFDTQLDLLTLIGKYNFQIVHEFAKIYFGSFYAHQELSKTGIRIFRLISIAESFKLHEIEESLKECFDEYWMTLPLDTLQQLDESALVDLVMRIVHEDEKPKVEFPIVDEDTGEVVEIIKKYSPYQENYSRVFGDLLQIAVKRKYGRLMNALIKKAEYKPTSDATMKAMLLESLDTLKKIFKK